MKQSFLLICLAIIATATFAGNDSCLAKVNTLTVQVMPVQSTVQQIDAMLTSGVVNEWPYNEDRAVILAAAASVQVDNCVESVSVYQTSKAMSHAELDAELKRCGIKRIFSLEESMSYANTILSNPATSNGSRSYTIIPTLVDGKEFTMVVVPPKKYTYTNSFLFFKKKHEEVRDGSVFMYPAAGATGSWGDDVQVLF